MIVLAVILLLVVALVLLGLGTVSVAYISQLTITETLTGVFVSPADATVTVSGLNETATYDASSTPAATKATAYQKALSSGTATIDLTSLPGLTSDETITFSGLKMVAYKFRNPSTNANNITITFGASNPHLIFGAAGKVVLPPGAVVTGLPLATGLTIDATHCTIDLTGTLSQALDVELVAG